MGMFALVVRFEVKPGHEEAFDALTARTVAGVLEHEPDTLLYVTHTVEDAPQSRLFYELYRSPEAKAVHDAQEHVKTFMAERGQHLTGHRVEFLAPLDPLPAHLGGAS